MGRTRWADAIMGAASAGALAVSAWLVPTGGRLAAQGGEPLPISCWLRLVFGFECPTCGLTRSFVASMHGDLAGALGWHPAGPLLVLGAMIVLGLVVIMAVRRNPPLWGRPGFSLALSAASLAVLGLGLVRLALMQV